MNCKLCNSDNVIKWGKYKDVQRYYCKDCHSKFKADEVVLGIELALLKLINAHRDNQNNKKRGRDN